MFTGMTTVALCRTHLDNKIRGSNDNYRERQPYRFAAAFVIFFFGYKACAWGVSNFANITISVYIVDYECELKNR